MAPKRTSSTRHNAPPAKRSRTQFDSSKSQSHKSAGGGASSKRFSKIHEPKDKAPRRKAPITSQKAHADDSGAEDEDEDGGFEEVPMDEDEPEEHDEDTGMVEGSTRESHANGNDNCRSVMLDLTGIT